MKIPSIPNFKKKYPISMQCIFSYSEVSVNDEEMHAWAAMLEILKSSVHPCYIGSSPKAYKAAPKN